MLLDPERPGIAPGALLVEGGRIAARLAPDEPAPESARIVGLRGALLAPGLLDVHVHGSFVFARPEQMEAALHRDAATWVRHGVTGFLATTVSWSRDFLTQAMTRLVPVLSDVTSFEAIGARPLGLHLEGPWIRSEAAGAQPTAAIRPFDASDREVFDIAAETVRMVTLAPELPGSAELLGELTRREIVASLGHSLADSEQIDAAVKQGARHATHLFNAMGPLHQRGPGTAAAILAHEGLGCDLIGDGAHVHPDWVRVAARVKGDKLVLVTDRVDPPHDANDASFGSGRLRDDGTAWTLPDGRLAGSRLMLDRAIANVTQWGALGLADAVAACTLRPARLLGLEAEVGTLRPKARADLVVLESDGRVRETWIGGRRVYATA